jgi:hypothetical protein
VGAAPLHLAAAHALRRGAQARAPQVIRGRGVRAAAATAAPTDAAHTALLESVAAWVGGLIQKGAA